MRTWWDNSMPLNQQDKRHSQFHKQSISFSTITHNFDMQVIGKLCASNNVPIKTKKCKLGGKSMST